MGSWIVLCFSKIVELCSGVQLIYLIWSIQGLLFTSLLGGNWAVSSLGLIFPTIEANPLMSLVHPVHHVLWGFPCQLEGKAWYLACVSSEVCSLCSFQTVLFPPQVVSSHTCSDQSSGDFHGEPCEIPELSPILCSVLQTSCLGLPGLPSLFPQLKDPA